MTNTITPVTKQLNEYGLNSEDWGLVQDIVNNTPTTRQGVDNFGITLGNTDYVNSVLDKASSDDLGAVGEKMTEIAQIAKSVNLDSFNKRSNLPIIGKIVDKFMRKTENMKIQFANANKQIGTIINEVGTLQETINQRNDELEQMFTAVTAEYKGLGIHIIAGKIKIGELKQIVAEKQEEYKKTNNPLLVQEISDLNFAIASLDKRIGDLSVMQHATLQTMPAIRIIQSNNKLLADKFATIKEVTIPAWKNQFMLALTLSEQQNHVAMADMIDNATDELLKSNADLLHQNAVGASVASQRLAINVDTLQEVHDKLLMTINDVIKTQSDGEKSRTQAISKLHALSARQSQSLISLGVNNG